MRFVHSLAAMEKGQGQRVLLAVAEAAWQWLSKGGHAARAADIVTAGYLGQHPQQEGNYGNPLTHARAEVCAW